MENLWKLGDYEREVGSDQLGNEPMQYQTRAENVSRKKSQTTLLFRTTLVVEPL